VLEEKVALVTGGAGGLGTAIALRFATEGSHVVIGDINSDATKKTVDEVVRSGGKASGVFLDVSDKAQVHSQVDQVVEELGRIDILVNNAGITRYRPFAAIDETDWDAVLAVDLKGVFFCSQAVAPHMRARKAGKIVNISSVQGTGATPHAAGGSPGGSSAYASAKAAVIQLTKTLAREMGPSGVNVNAVAPGFFLTDLTSATRSPEEVEEHIRVRAQSAVLNRVGRIEELASVVTFLASDDASFLTGQTLCVDGGRTDRM